MSSIPLPALHLNPPPQQADPLEQFARLQQLKTMMQNAPLQQQALQQQVQTGQMQLQQEQQSMKDQQMFRQVMADPSMQGKTIGEVADTLAQKGSLSPATYQQLKKVDVEQRTALASLDEKQLANAKAAHEQTQTLYNNVMNMPDDQLTQNWPQIAQQYDAIPGNQKMPLNPQQPLSKQQLAQFGPFVTMQNAYIDQEMARRKAQTEQQTAETTLGQKQAESKFYQQNGGAPGVSAELMQQSDWLKKNPGKGPSDYKLWMMRNSPMAVVMNNQLGGAQNQDALDLAADNYRKTGQLPAGFSRSPQTTAAVIARAAELEKQNGGNGIAANKADLKSLSDSLNKLQTTYQTTAAFEKTAEKNIDLLQQTAKNIPDLGTRFANVPVRQINAKMIGTEAMARFNTALTTAQTEAAKVLNNPGSNAALSDSARAELQKVIDGNLPYKALVGSLDTLRQDMRNRNDSYQQQIGDLQGRIKGVGNAPQSSTGNSGTPKIGDVKKFPNGRTGKWDGQGWVAQ